jgi:hypothetical protein
VPLDLARLIACSTASPYFAQYALKVSAFRAANSFSSCSISFPAIAFTIPCTPLKLNGILPPRHRFQMIENRSNVPAKVRSPHVTTHLQRAHRASNKIYFFATEEQGRKQPTAISPDLKFA